MSLKIGNQWVVQNSTNEILISLLSDLDPLPSILILTHSGN